MKEITGDEQVFPVAMPGHVYSDGSSELPYVKPGMTLYQYAFIYAPSEIPAWFKHTLPSKDGIPPAPNWENIEDLNDRQTVRDWLDDGIADLPGHLQWFSDANAKSYDAKMKWEVENKIAKYFQWRSYFASQFINYLKIRE